MDLWEMNYILKLLYIHWNFSISLNKFYILNILTWKTTLDK